MSDNDVLDHGHTEATTTATFDRWYARETGAPGFFSKITIPESTLANVIGCKSAHLRAEDRALTHIDASVANPDSGRPVGITVHFRDDKGNQRPASNTREHHLWTNEQDSHHAVNDTYNMLLTGAETKTLPIAVEQIPVQKANATVARWGDIKEPENIGSEIQHVTVTTEKGEEKTLATFPAESPLGRLYDLNTKGSGTPGFLKHEGKTVKMTTYNHDEDGRPHIAVDNHQHALSKAEDLRNALSDPHDFKGGLDVYAHVIGNNSPGPVHVNMQFRRNNGNEITPIGCQVEDGQTGKFTDKGSVSMPSGISRNVLQLVDGQVSDIKCDTAGSD